LISDPSNGQVEWVPLAQAAVWRRWFDLKIEPIHPLRLGNPRCAFGMSEIIDAGIGPLSLVVMLLIFGASQR